MQAGDSRRFVQRNRDSQAQPGQDFLQRFQSRIAVFGENLVEARPFQAHTASQIAHAAARLDDVFERDQERRAVLFPPALARDIRRRIRDRATVSSNHRGGFLNPCERCNL